MAGLYLKWNGKPLKVLGMMIIAILICLLSSLKPTRLLCLCYREKVMGRKNKSRENAKRYHMITEEMLWVCL